MIKLDSQKMESTPYLRQSSSLQTD